MAKTDLEAQVYNMDELRLLTYTIMMNQAWIMRALTLAFNIKEKDKFLESFDQMTKMCNDQIDKITGEHKTDE